jgi:hypothetical protein
MKSYFSGVATGVKADIKRHAKTKIELETMIADAEANGDTIYADAYRNLLVILKHSGAEANSKIGLTNNR